MFVSLFSWRFFCWTKVVCHLSFVFWSKKLHVVKRLFTFYCCYKRKTMLECLFLWKCNGRWWSIAFWYQYIRNGLSILILTIFNEHNTTWFKNTKCYCKLNHHPCIEIIERCHWSKKFLWMESLPNAMIITIKQESSCFSNNWKNIVSSLTCKCDAQKHVMSTMKNKKCITFFSWNVEEEFQKSIEHHICV